MYPGINKQSYKILKENGTMLKITLPLYRRMESIFILLIFSFFLFEPANIKADDNVEVKGQIQVKTNTSITVSSIEFLVNSSTKISGEQQNNISFDSLKVGMFVEVEAKSQQNGTLLASEIRLKSNKVSIELEGSITALTSNSLTVNGTEVFVDSNTVIFTQYHASIKFSNLNVGDSIEVKATQITGGKYFAIAIKLLTKNSYREIELEGKIQAITNNSIKVLNVEFFVDNSTIIMSRSRGILKLSDLAVGNQVSVRGFLRQDSTYIALMIKIKDEEFDRKELELKGPITEINSNSIVVNNVTFYVDSSTVIFAHEGKMLSFSELNVGDIVEVEAVLQLDGTYKAYRIKVEDDESKKEIELSGLIEVVNSDNISVGGFIVYVNSQTKIYTQNKKPLTLNDLKAGTSVEVKAYFQNNNYYASLIKVHYDNKTRINITGSIEAISGNSLTVSGTTFITDENTEFLDESRNQITISDLKVGQIVKVKAILQNGNQYYALRIEVEDYWRSALVVEGKIDEVGVDFVKVLNKTFYVNSKTVFVGTGSGVIDFSNLSIGLKVEVIAKADSTGKLIARLIKVESENEFEVYGKVENISGTQLVVAGLTLNTDNNTVYNDEFDQVATFNSLKINQIVEVHYTKSLGVNLAIKIKIEKEYGSVVMSGIVTLVNTNSIQLSVPSVSINSNTVFLNSAYTPILYSSISAGQAVAIWASPDKNGNMSATQVQQISGSTTSVPEDGSSNLPVSFSLQQNYPNPFNPTTNIIFTLTKPENVTLKVYNIIGQEVATLVNGLMNTGSHVVTFNATNLASGVYFYRLKAGDFTDVKKMLLLK